MRMTKKQLEEKACALGLNLNYKPNVLIPNIFDCGEAEWIKSMKEGIGSSSAAVAMGRCRYKTPSEIVIEKILGNGFFDDDIEEDGEGDGYCDPAKQYRLDSGHQQETALLKWYANMLGYEIALTDPNNPSTSDIKDVSEITDEEWKEWEGKGVVCVDHARYGHPEYPFMFTDPDGVCYPPSRERYCIEFKTADSREFSFKWKTGVYPNAKVGNPGYIYQARHHMAVLNVNRCDIVAACDFNSLNNVVVTVYRDMEEEKKLIDKESEVWDQVKKGIVPTFTMLSNRSYSNIATLLTPNSLDEEEFALSEGCRPTVSEIFTLKEEKKELQERIKEIDERVNALNASIIPFMDGHAHANMPSLIEGKTIYFDLGSSSRKSFNKDKLRLEMPEVYEQYEEIKVSPDKKLTIKEKKTVKKKA